MVKTLVVLLPAYNEEDTVDRVIDDIPYDMLNREGYEIRVVVANGPSTDDTERIAVEKGATVYNCELRGKGNGVKDTLGRIDFSYDCLVMLDSDFTYPSEYVCDIVKALDEYDVVIGSRLNGYIEDHALSRANKFGNKMLSLLASKLFGRQVSDVCTGMWGFRKRVLDNIIIDASGFQLEANLFVEAVKGGFSFGEIPISYRKRANKAKLGGGLAVGAVWDGLKIGGYLFRRCLLDGSRKCEED